MCAAWQLGALGSIQDGMNNVNGNLTHHYQPRVTVLNMGDNLALHSLLT